MKITTKIYEKKNGELVYEIKYIADRKSRSIQEPLFDDLDLINYKIDEIEFPIVNKVYMVASNTYVGPNKKEVTQTIYFTDDNEVGWAGNSDHNIKRYHGWRGTSDDWAFNGEGVRICKNVYINGHRSRTVRIIFGKDLKVDEA